MFTSLFLNINYRLGAIVLAEFFMLKASEASREDLCVLIEKVKDRLVRAEKARKEDNWIAALREINAMIAEGVDFSQLVINMSLCTVQYSVVPKQNIEVSKSFY